MDTHPTATEPPLKVSEAARRLNVHRQTVLTLISDGTLAAVKVGQQWRVSPASVAAILEPLETAPR